MKSPKRNERPSWDEYFLTLARAVSQRSRDESKVGAIIVSQDNCLVATGYNGLARDVLDLEHRMKPRKEKLRWVCHAEANAVFSAARAGIAVCGGTIYVNKFPCVDCTNAIVQSGIVRVVTDARKPWQKSRDDDDGSRAIRIMAEAGVKLVAPNLPLARPSRRNTQARPKRRGVLGNGRLNGHSRIVGAR